MQIISYSFFFLVGFHLYILLQKQNRHAEMRFRIGLSLTRNKVLSKKRTEFEIFMLQTLFMSNHSKMCIALTIPIAAVKASDYTLIHRLQLIRTLIVVSTKFSHRMSKTVIN